MRSCAILAALAPLVLALPAQLPFTSPASSLFLPANTQSDFQVLTLPAFEDHRVRVRTPKGLCDPAVEQKSGYLDAGKRFVARWKGM